MVNAACLRVSLDYIDPVPWRRVEVPLSLSLNGLHACIQATFLWTNSHLWEFEIDKRRYSDVMEDFSDFGGGGDRVLKASNVQIGKVVESGTKEFFYVYDMGDDWVHLVEIEELFEADPKIKYPRYLDGEWAAPPDDCGGPPGFENFKQIMATPNHPEHEELLEWYGGPFDPAFIDEEQVVVGMNVIARRRRKKP
jgi:hypothetical protein